MARLLYSAVFYLLLPLLFLRLWFKGRKSPQYRRRWAERLGFFTPPSGIERGICFHCVSVGETLAAVRLIRDIQQQYPQMPITVTTTTPTGSEQVRLAFGDSVFHVYLPFDTIGGVRRFFRKIRPRTLIIMETELWPNLLHYARRAQCQTLLANARLSAKSAEGYAKISALTHKMLNDIQCVAAHHDSDGERFIELGLEPSKLVVTGSIKFDIAIDDELAAKSTALKQQWAETRPVWVVGSTHQDEDEIVLAAFHQVLERHPTTLLVLVPRHPERFGQVADLVVEQGLSMTTRSSGQAPDESTQVVLGDTMGELKLLWGIADIAFVGGSLVNRGGHNPLEPALFAVPVISGPEVFNFAQIYQLLDNHEAVIFATDAETLAQSVLHLLDSPSYRRKLGTNGAKVVEQNRGALARLKAQITGMLS